MKHVYKLLAFLLLALPAFGTITLNATIAAVGGLNSATTANYDTSGCNSCLISLAVSSLTAVADAAVTDSKSNTYTCDTPRQTNAIAYLSMCSCVNCTVGTGHNFTCTRTAGHCAIGGFAFDSANGGVDQTNSAFDNSGSASFIATGSVTPGTAGQVLVAAICFGQSDATPTIDSSFVSPLPVYITQAGASNQGLGLSYLIETTATTKNPNFSFGAVFYISATITTFKAGGGGGAVIHNLTTLGVGQ